MRREAKVSSPSVAITTVGLLLLDGLGSRPAADATAARAELDRLVTEVGQGTLVCVAESEWQSLYRHEAKLLGELGAPLVRVELPRVEVRLPRALAEQAVAAWERDEDGPRQPETFEQRVQRHRAGTFSLIGLEITERRRWDGDEVIIALNAGLIAAAVDASDDLPPPASPFPSLAAASRRTRHSRDRPAGC